MYSLKRCRKKSIITPRDNFSLVRPSSLFNFIPCYPFILSFLVAKSRDEIVKRRAQCPSNSPRPRCFLKSFSQSHTEWRDRPRGWKNEKEKTTRTGWWNDHEIYIEWAASGATTSSVILVRMHETSTIYMFDSNVPGGSDYRTFFIHCQISIYKYISKCLGNDDKKSHSFSRAWVNRKMQNNANLNFNKY